MPVGHSRSASILAAVYIRCSDVRLRRYGIIRRCGWEAAVLLRDSESGIRGGVGCIEQSRDSLSNCKRAFVLRYWVGNGGG